MRQTWLSCRCRCGWGVRLPAAWAKYQYSPALRYYACHGRLRPVRPPRRRRAARHTVPYQGAVERPDVVLEAMAPVVRGDHKVSVRDA